MAKRTELQPLIFTTRMPALDGLRALAVIAVFALHYGGGAHSGHVLSIYNQIRLRGWMGVDLFFALSGFLITGILYDTRNDSEFFKRFYARRSLRIFPVFYAVVAVLLILTPIVQYQWKPVQYLFLLYLGNIPAGLNVHLLSVPAKLYPTARVHLGHLWSLCVEEQFYLLWPVIVWWIRSRTRLINLAMSLIVAALVLRIAVVLYAPRDMVWTLTYYMLPCRMDSLLSGATLALLLRGPSVDVWQRRCVPLFVVGATMITALFLFSPAEDSPWLMTIGYSLIAAMSVGLIGMTIRPDSASFRIFRLRPLRVLGRYSYGFYVYHLLWASAWSYAAAVLSARLHSSTLGGILCDIVNFGLSFLVAKLSYDLYESRFLKWKRFFLYDCESLAAQEVKLP